MKAKGIFKIVKWDESDISELPGSMKITNANVKYSISGEIEGEAVMQYLMFYSYFDKKDQHNSSARYVGLMQFTGQLSGKQGTIVLQDNGSFKSGAVHSNIEIMENSGTSDLKNIKGSGKYTADQNGMNIEIDFQ